MARSLDLAGLAGYAQAAGASRGRRWVEPDHPYRTAYQRDRDRIVHSRAFRRLEYKTQVFVNHEGDHYRTRLTHTIEVAQIGRTVGRVLRLNEDLIESLALCHDLGHTPFGHLGEEILDERLAGHGGFNHNRQTLRIVEHLEERYAAFPGLNLTWEVREGIAKHSGPIDAAAAPEFAEYEVLLEGPLEIQLIDWVDEIAYNHHDVDDGIASGLLDAEHLARAVPLFGGPYDRAGRELGGAPARQRLTAALRGMIDTLVTDLIESSAANLERSGARSVDDVRRAGRPLAALSAAVGEENRRLKAYLHGELYRHPAIERMKQEARRMLEALYERYSREPHLVPGEGRRAAETEPLERRIADYIAGMTDRFAIQEYERLCGPRARA